MGKGVGIASVKRVASIERKDIHAQALCTSVYTRVHIHSERGESEIARRVSERVRQDGTYAKSHDHALVAAVLVSLEPRRVPAGVRRGNTMLLLRSLTRLRLAQFQQSVWLLEPAIRVVA